MNTHMLVGLWMYLCTSLVGLWVNTICLWGCGCVCVHFVCGGVVEYTHACGVVGVFVHFACGVVGEYNMLVGLWVCVHFVCGDVGEYTHACGVVGVRLCLWGNGCVCFACGFVGEYTYACGVVGVTLYACGCKPITCGVVCVFACGVFDNVPCGVEIIPCGVAKKPH